MKKTLLVVLLAQAISTSTQAQAPEKWSAAQIQEALQKAQVLGSVLYVAAHPDDENTRMIAYMANERKMNTAYLSLTRGDGGQNLIGAEIRELLGVIRTQELLAARRTDGGKQYFTRANDFGYSKTPQETLEIWNKDEVLADVIWAIRKHKPDVIINRFSDDLSRETHGHHTTSAVLSVEAFDLANNPNIYPEQLQYTTLWQPKRLFFNTSWWFYGSMEAFEKADKTNMVSVDVGVYYPLKGKSNTEIAAESRSMHRCQGFGSTGTRGSDIEYLQLLKGDAVAADPLEGINTTWTRVAGGAAIGKLLAKIEADFNPAHPDRSVPALLKAYNMVANIGDAHWKAIKLAELKAIIKACMGLYVEAIADAPSATPDQAIQLSIEATNRSSVAAVLTRVVIAPMGVALKAGGNLGFNQRLAAKETLHLPATLDYTSHYWLRQTATEGMYQVADQRLRGLPETPRALVAQFEVNVGGVLLSFETDVVYKFNDPARGERFQPFEITPPVFANLTEKVYVFANNAPQSVQVRLRAGRDGVRGTLRLAHAEGWQVTPSTLDFALSTKGEEQSYTFTVSPPQGTSDAALTPQIALADANFASVQGIYRIEYDHIPTQTVLTDPTARAVKIDLVTKSKRIGYLMGAGDDVPAALRQMGCEVALLEDADLTADRLATFDAVVVGVRAYNTLPNLKFRQAALLDYVKNGGTMVVQYNTNTRLTADPLGPYPLTLSRERVTKENAPVTFLVPNHPVLHTPNLITAADFEGWVQERGLYFPSKWDDHYTPVLSCHDPNEPARDGGLLVAQYGKGWYVYTGYSWFRELPAGVPGAFRLFANLISLGKSPIGLEE